MATDRLKLGVLASALTDQVRQAPTIARQAGFDGLLFDAFSAAVGFPDLSGSGRREFLHLLSTQERQLIGLRLELGPKGLAPGADVDAALSRLDRVLESSAGLGSPLVCLDLGPLPEPPRKPQPRPKVNSAQAGLIFLPTAQDVAAAAPQLEPRQTVADKLDENVAAHVDGALVELGRLADRYSVIIACRSELSSLSALERALAQAGCPWFGVDLDPVAILRDPLSMDEAFSRFGPLIRHVRARDAARGADRRTQPAVLGRGGIDWREFLANVDAAAYHGWVTVDPMELSDRPAAARAARDHLLAIK